MNEFVRSSSDSDLSQTSPTIFKRKYLPAQSESIMPIVPLIHQNHWRALSQHNRFACGRTDQMVRAKRSMFDSSLAQVLWKGGGCAYSGARTKLRCQPVRPSVHTRDFENCRRGFFFFLNFETGQFYDKLSSHFDVWLKSGEIKHACLCSGRRGRHVGWLLGHPGRSKDESWFPRGDFRNGTRGPFRLSG